MAVAFVASSLVGDGQTATTSSVVATVPAAAAAGNVALVHFEINVDTGVMATPAGWTLLSGPNRQASPSNTTYLFGKVLASGDPGSTVTFTYSETRRIVGTVTVFSGATLTGRLTASNTGGAAATTALPTLAGVPAGAMVVGFFGREYNGAAQVSVGTPTSYTAGPESRSNYASATNVTSKVAYKLAATAGAYGGESATQTQSASGINHLVALLASGGPSTFAPTVNAGADASVAAGAAFARTAVESDGGSPITSRAWTIVSGPAGAGSTIGTSDALSWTPTVSGAYTLRYSATNAVGTGTDDVAVTVTASATAPVVTAGADATVQVDQIFMRTATESGGGAPITSRAWLIVSGPVGVGSMVGAAATLAWTPTTAGSYVLRYTAANTAGSGSDDVAVTVSVAPPRDGWSMWSRTAGYVLDVDLPILSAQMVLRHMGVDRAVITTPYSQAAYASLQPGRGVVLYRDGQQTFSGKVGPLELDWDAENGRTIIKAECAGDTQDLADRLVFPDPLRAADDQTVNDYWTASGVASTAMRQLISDQAGPTCHAGRRIPGLVLGADPGVGLNRTWTGLFDAAGPQGVLSQLAVMSVVSGEDLGLRVTTTPGALTFEVVQPRDLAASAKFSVEFGNVAGIRYRLEPPTATHALSAGQGDLHLRLRKLAVTASSLALSWGRQVWRYIDRRDTADPAELLKAAQDALEEGDATVSLACTLLDSEAAMFGRDWGLGDRITVYVRVPGQDGPVAEVSDVVREVLIEVDDKGAEKIRPAIGSYDAKAVIPTPSQQALARVSDSLSGLIARK